MAGWSTLSDDAAALRRLAAELHSAFASGDAVHHRRAAAAARARYDEVVDAWRDRAEAARRGERSAVEECLRYLEAWPWFPGSGFLAIRILRRLRQSGLLIDDPRFVELQRLYSGGHVSHLTSAERAPRGRRGGRRR